MGDIGGALGSVTGGVGDIIGGTLSPLSKGIFGGSTYNPQSAPLLAPATADQLSTSYGQTQTGLDQQMQFLQALQAQNGVGNQSAIYNQLAGVANGTGPNPALAALNQATGANVANQAALAAGQRGAGSNVGLIARQAGLQGGNLQQQAAGQGATLLAQQQLGALNAAGNIAGNQVANQANATGAYNQFAQNQQSNLIGGANGLNNALVGQQSQINSINQQNAQANKGFIGNVLGAAGTVAAGAKSTSAAHGGMIKQNFAYGTPSAPVSSRAEDSPDQIMAAASPIPQGGVDLSQPIGGTAPASIAPKAPMSAGASFFQKLAQGVDSSQQQQTGMAPPSGQDVAGQGFGKAIGSLFARGGPVPAKVSPGEHYIPPGEVAEVAAGEKAAIAAGEKIPGKSKVKGDSLKNDTVDKTLQEGGIVLPRSVTEAKDAPAKAAAFVAAVLKKQGLSRGR